MKALVVDPEGTAGFNLGEVPEPVPAPHQAVVDVHAFAVTARHLVYGPRLLPPGGIWGFDLAGTVTTPAADGSGPPAGAPVVGLAEHPGSWAQRIAIDAADLAVVPEGVDAVMATAMLIPGIAALQALRRFGPLRDRHLLVTAAGGAAGWYAGQLAALAGMRATALVRDPARAPHLAEVGFDRVVTALDQVDMPVHAAIDLVGGPALVAVFDMLAESGSVQAMGAVAGEPATFGPDAFHGRRRTLESFWGTWPVGADLAHLLALVSDGRLRMRREAWRGGWDRIGEVPDRLSAGGRPAEVILTTD
jgi:NADPH2:quinone reductase